MFDILFVWGASTFPQFYYIHELTVQLKNLIKIKDSWRDLVDISYTVYNCPNTEKYRVNKIHIGRDEI